VTNTEMVEVLTGPFKVFGVNLDTIRWDLYFVVLEPQRLDDLKTAIGPLLQTHAFHNAPLPAEVLNRVNEAKQQRLNRSADTPQARVDPSEGELQEFTIPGMGTIKIRVLPDDHPALLRYCHDCGDTGWMDAPHTPAVQRTVKRCHCWKTNPKLQRDREANARYASKQRA
jgi:hypothetical protein